jgi:glycerophosphoryl diester phosphodiesterase
MMNYTIIAHRGITENGYNDNSLESLLEIKNIKSDFNLGIEFDIQITKDNKIILYHDEYLNNNKISDLLYSQIIEMNTKIIKLDDILKEFNKTNYLLDIELKSYLDDGFDKYTDIVIDIISNYEFNYILTSFNLNIVNLLQKKNILNVYLISEDLDKVKTNITNYKLYNSFSNIIGIYTLYDDGFNENILKDLLRSDIILLITDNVEKLNNYLKNY